LTLPQQDAKRLQVRAQREVSVDRSTHPARRCRYRRDRDPAPANTKPAELAALRTVGRSEGARTTIVGYGLTSPGERWLSQWPGRPACRRDRNDYREIHGVGVEECSVSQNATTLGSVTLDGIADKNGEPALRSPQQIRLAQKF